MLQECGSLALKENLRAMCDNLPPSLVLRFVRPGSPTVQQSSSAPVFKDPPLALPQSYTSLHCKNFARDIYYTKSSLNRHEQMADYTARWELELPGRVEPPSTPTTPTPTWETKHLVERELHAYPASARFLSSSAPSSLSRATGRNANKTTFPQSPCDAAALARATEERHRRISTTHPPEVLAVRRMKAYPSLPGLSGKYDGSWDGKLDGHQWGCGRGRLSRSRAREEATGKVENGLEVETE